MADEERSESVQFDEALLFREFDAEATTRETNVSEEVESPELRSLQRENALLKAALGKIVCHKSAGSTHAVRTPLIQALFFDNSDSRRRRQQLEEFLQSICCSSENNEEPCCLGSENFQPSISELNLSRSVVVDSDDRLSEDSQTSFISSVRYFDIFCIDCTGFPLVDFNPAGTDGWTIPFYEQTFFTVLPCSDDSAKIKIRQRKKCFNCSNEGHDVRDCPEPQNQAKIDANRREFVNKFSSPFSKEARYHVENQKRYGHFRAGVISDNLREALGISENELPLHVYRMRYLGYPPAYMPKSGDQPSLLIYDGQGNIDNSVMEGPEEEESEDDSSIFIKYPGFNVPVPEGVVDRARELGMPPMQEYQQLHNVLNMYKQIRNRQQGDSSGRRGQPPKRKWSELDRQEQDMEMDDEGAGLPTEIGLPQTKLNGGYPQKRLKYDDSGSDGGGYSPAHPGVECGKAEIELLSRYRRRSKEDKDQPPLSQGPTETGHQEKASAGSSTSKRRRSREEGELVSDEEENEEEKEEEEEEEAIPQRTSGFWLNEPLAQLLERNPKPRPPPRPPVVLPMDALTRFYTSCTVLQQHGFQDRFLWLDPVYGNVQVPSGRYDRVKKILGKKSSRR